jgi:hypothetical protein
MKRRDLGMAVLGAAAGVAGCSQPVKSLFVPDATAANGRGPDNAPIRWLYLRKQQVGSFFGVGLPGGGDDWHATSSHPHVVEISEKTLRKTGDLHAKVIGEGYSIIQLTGKNGENLEIIVDTRQ